MREYNIGDVIEYKGLNENLSGHVQKTGFILKINKNGTFIVGNAFVDYQNIVPAMLDTKHKLNNITLVDRSELVSNIGNL